MIKQYAGIVKSVAMKGVRYIPLNEIMRESIKLYSPDSTNIKTTQFSYIVGILKHYYLSKNLDEAFEHYGFYYLTDGVHLNSRGGELITQLIVDEVKLILNSDSRLTE